MTNVIAELIAELIGVLVGCLLIPLLPWNRCWSIGSYLDFWRRVLAR